MLFWQKASIRAFGKCSTIECFHLGVYVVLGLPKPLT